MMKLSRRELKEELKDTPIETILGTHVSRTLTGKQKAFALEVAKGQTKASAYRKAYKPNATKRTLAGAPYELANDPRISREIKAYELAIEAAKHRSPAALRELVISGLVEIALSPDTKDAVKVQALKTIGQITEVSAFTIRTETKTITSSETAKASILAQLQTLMAGEATDVVSRDADSLLAELRTVESENTEPQSDGANTLSDDAPDADPPVGGEAAGGSGVPSL
jgi:hypothetical protein